MNYLDKETQQMKQLATPEKYKTFSFPACMFEGHALCMFHWLPFLAGQKAKFTFNIKDMT